MPVSRPATVSVTFATVSRAGTTSSPPASTLTCIAVSALVPLTCGVASVAIGAVGPAAAL